jgi:hypothetical protein
LLVLYRRRPGEEEYREIGESPGRGAFDTA